MGLSFFSLTRIKMGIGKLSVLLVGMMLFSSCTFKEYKNQGPTTLTVVEPTFASLQKNVFTPKCISCHSGSAAPHGIKCTSYAHIMNSPVFPPLVLAGNPEASGLYTAVANGRMPKDNPTLSKMEIDAIYTWIRNGAKEFEDQPLPSPSPTPGEPGCEPGEPGCDDGGQPNSEFSKNEPCDLSFLTIEPGIKNCNIKEEMKH